MVAIEVKGEGNLGSQQLLWERDIIWGRNLYGASNYLFQELQLDALFFSLFLLWKRLATRLSLVNCQNGFEVGHFFQLEKTLWAAEKDTSGAF